MSLADRILPLFLLALLALPTYAGACQIGWKSEAELEAEASVVVDARIVTARRITSSPQRDVYEYKIIVESSETGELSDGEMAVTFDDLKAHLRDRMRVCPIKNGSGIEHNLTIGQLYKLYIKSNSEPQIVLARVENARRKQTMSPN